jgi:chromosome segregation ATPase
MNVEKTMEFILAQQAKAEGQMAAIRKLIQTGMRMIVKQEESIREVKDTVRQLADSHKETQKELKQLAQAQKELAVSQKVTEIKLQAFIDSLRRGGNGRQSKN